MGREMQMLERLLHSELLRASRALKASIFAHWRAKMEALRNFLELYF